MSDVSSLLLDVLFLAEHIPIPLAFTNTMRSAMSSMMTSWFNELSAEFINSKFWTLRPRLVASRSTAAKTLVSGEKIVVFLVHPVSVGKKIKK